MIFLVGTSALHQGSYQPPGAVHLIPFNWEKLAFPIVPRRETSDFFLTLQLFKCDLITRDAVGLVEFSSKKKSFEV